MGCHVLKPDRTFGPAYMSQKTKSLGRFCHAFALFLREAKNVEIANTAQRLEGQERTVPGARQLSSAIDNFLENGFGIQVFGDADAGFAQPG